MELYFKCAKCGGEDFDVRVNISILISPKFIRRLTKRAFQTKDIQLWGAEWDKAWAICKNCHYFERLYDDEEVGGRND